MSRGHLLLAAVVAGAIAGSGVAAVQAVSDDPPPGAASAALEPPPPERVVFGGRLADGRYDPDFGHLRIHRETVRIEARVADPGGGPDWVLRTFDGDRLRLERPSRTLRGANVTNRSSCVQLGRESGGRFGWVYGDGRFHEAHSEDQLTRCRPRSRPGFQREAIEIVDIANPARPEIRLEILWGQAPLSRRLALSGTAGTDGPLRLGARGGFLLVAPKDARLAAGTLTLDGRRRITVAYPSAARKAAIRPGSVRIEARTPDPAGGPPHGTVVAETADGRPCIFGGGQIVEGRVGGLETRLGTFFAHGTNGGCSTFPKLPREIKCSINTGFSNTQEVAGEDPLMRRARIERRLLPGRATVSAMCRPDVERVTLRTPRDIRTLRPSPVGRVIFAIYDGEFPSGDLVLTAHLADGRTWVERFPLGF